MIDYENDKWRFFIRVSGSVVPKCLPMAVFAAGLTGVNSALFVYLDIQQVDPPDIIKTSWGWYLSILGFLLVFRTQQAYQRFWEGATLVQQAQGEWFNSTSSLISFSSSEAVKKRDVDAFQQTLVRLMSILYCCALHQIADSDYDHFNIISVEGLSLDSLRFLDQTPKNSKCEIVLQWVQRLIINNISNGVVSAPAPIVSRAFQELSRGIVNINEARKIVEVPFPFAYAQMVWVLLILFTVGIPFQLPLYGGNWWQAVLWAFVISFIAWGVYQISIEIEMPFGDDPNDLPLANLQDALNHNLLLLLDRRSQKAPTLDTSKMLNSMDTLDASQVCFSGGDHLIRRASSLSMGIRPSEIEFSHPDQRLSQVRSEGSTQIAHTRSSLATLVEVDVQEDEQGGYGTNRGSEASQAGDEAITASRSEPDADQQSSLLPTALADACEEVLGRDNLPKPPFHSHIHIEPPVKDIDEPGLYAAEPDDAADPKAPLNGVHSTNKTEVRSPLSTSPTRDPGTPVESRV